MRLLQLSLLWAIIPLIAGYVQTSQPPLTPQQILVENAKEATFSLYDTQEPYWKRMAKNNTVDLSVEMLNDYAITLPGMPSITPQAQLKKRLEGYPVIVVGTALAQQSTITPKSSYIVSDWTIKVTRLLKNNSPMEIKADQPITVARTGGTVTVGNLKLIAHDGNFADFQLQHTYVLALRPLEKTGSFLAENFGSFDVTGSAVVYMDDPQAPGEIREWVGSYSSPAFIEVLTSLITEGESVQ